jgi:hypothetical protein
MNILDYTQNTMTRHCHEIMFDDGFCTYYSGGSRRHKDAASRSKVQTSGNETTCKEGFNSHSLKLPNGCVIEVKENGEVYMCEEGGQAKKIRNKDSLQKLLVK